MRLLICATLLLLALTGRAEGFGNDRKLWLEAYNLDPIYVYTWATGVGETLFLVAIGNGCMADGVVGKRLATETAEMLRADPKLAPLPAAFLAYGRLTGCSEALNRGVKVGKFKDR
jgi:hypothetical protein